MLVPFPRQSCLHQTLSPFRDNNFLMRRDVVAMGMRNKRERFRIPGIQPEVVLGQINSTLVSDLNHIVIYAQKSGRCDELTLGSATRFVSR